MNEAASGLILGRPYAILLMCIHCAKEDLISEPLSNALTGPTDQFLGVEKSLTYCCYEYEYYYYDDDDYCFYYIVFLTVIPVLIASISVFGMMMMTIVVPTIVIIIDGASTYISSPLESEFRSRFPESDPKP